MQRPVVLGEVMGVFGVRGWIKLRSHTRPIEAILDYPVWQVGERRFELLDGRQQGPGLVASLDGIEDRDAAAALRGLTIPVSREELPPTRPGEYYWADLIGLEVRNSAGAVLGRVEEMMETGAHDVLVVRGSGRQTLIPFVQGPIVTRVDVPGGCLQVEWDEVE